MRWQVLFLAKQWHQADEYEDAFAADGDAGHFALADGASESSFARQWAQMLVHEFVRMPLGPVTDWSEWLPPLRHRWLEEMAAGPLPWYAEAKAELGAFATFLGVQVRDGQWHAVAVGDTCLFHLRDDQLIRCFPVTSSESFSSHPFLVGSRMPSPAALHQQQQCAQGTWEPGDQLLLMTDALAQWFLQETEAGERPWAEIHDLLTNACPEERFADWVARLREDKALRNDDVTLLAIG